MEKHVYFVRHGESESNIDGIHRGKEALLTEQGRAQTKEVAGRIEKIGVEALISSDFLRAFDTAGAISQRTGLPVEQSPLFGEWLEPSVNLGRHKDHPENKAIFEAMLASGHDPHWKHQDEESFHELKSRAEAGLRLLEEHPASRICVVTHGAFLRVLMGVIVFREKYTKHEFIDLFNRFVTNNTGVTYVRNTILERGWQMVSWNDSAHLG